MSGIFSNFQFLIHFIEFNKFQICNLSIVTLYIILRYEVRTHIIRLAFIVIRKEELLHRPLKIPELDLLCCMKPAYPSSGLVSMWIGAREFAHTPKLCQSFCNCGKAAVWHTYELTPVLTPVFTNTMDFSILIFSRTKKSVLQSGVSSPALCERWLLCHCICVD